MIHAHSLIYIYPVNVNKKSKSFSGGIVDSPSRILVSLRGLGKRE